MKTLLQLNTSLSSTGGQSSQLADQFVAAWRASHPGAEVIVRDLASQPLPHLDAERWRDRTAKDQPSACLPAVVAARILTAEGPLRPRRPASTPSLALGRRWPAGAPPNSAPR